MVNPVSRKPAMDMSMPMRNTLRFPVFFMIKGVTNMVAICATDRQLEMDA